MASPHAPHCTNVVREDALGAAEVDELYGRERKVGDAVRQPEDFELAGGSARVRLDVGRGRAHHDDAFLQAGPLDRHVAGLVTRRLLLFVGAVVFFVEDDDSDARQRREDGGTRAEHHVVVAAARAVPDAPPLGVGQT
jgi:hypothetical protein